MIRSNSARGMGRRAAALIAACGLVIAACGSDDEASGGNTTVAGEDTPATTVAGEDTPATTAAGEDTPATTAASAPVTCATDAVLTWGYGDQIRDWDPHDSPAGQDQWYLMTVYDRLFRQAPDGETLPGLAESWEFSDDALTLTLNIRQGVTFHDGTPLTTDIVAQNLDRARGAMNAPAGEEGFRSSFGADLGAIESVTAVDDTTVELALSVPAVSLPNVLSDRPGMMLLPSTFDGSANTDPIGTGPFMLDSWTEGEGGEAVLTKYADYWEADSIQIAGLVLKDIRDPSARINALQAGDIDGARIEPVDFDAAESNSDLTVVTGDTVEVYWMNLDIETTPELTIPEVRKAMSLAIDRQTLIDALAFGLGTATETLMPPFYYASSPNAVPVYDVAAAQQLLTDAGAGAFEFPILGGSTQGLGPSVSQAVIGMLAEIGITVNFDVAGANLASRLYFDRDGGGVVGPWSGRPDPYQTFANTDGPGFVNIAKTSIPEINDALAAANASTDPAERHKLLWKVDELSAQYHVSGIPLFSPKTIFAYDTSISGLPIYVQGKHEFRDACVAPS